MTKRRRRLAPPNEPVQRFRFSELTLHFISLLRQVDPEDRKDQLLLRDLLEQAGITPTYQNSWDYAHNQKIYDYIDCLETGKPYKLKKIRDPWKGRTEQKLKMERFWAALEQDLMLDIRKACRIADLDYDRTHTYLKTTEGRRRVDGIIQRRKDNNKGLEQSIIEGLKEMAFYNAFDLYDTKDGDRGFGSFKPLSEMPIGLQRAVQGVKDTKFGLEIKFQPKAQFFNLLMRNLGMLDSDTGTADAETLAIDLRKMAAELESALPGGTF